MGAPAATPGSPTEVARILAASFADAGRDLLGGRASALRVGLGALLVPLLPLVPLVTLVVYARELRFGAKLFRAFQARYGGPQRHATRAPIRVSLGEAA